MRSSLLYGTWLFLLDLHTLGSFTKVAQKHHLAPSTVMRRLQTLQKECGKTLFIESARGVKLTAQGLSYALEIRHQIAVLMDEPETSRQRTVQIYIDPHLSLRQLTEIIADTRQNNPDQLQLLALDNPNADIRVLASPIKTPLANPNAIGYCRLTTVAAPRYLNANGIPVSASDLSRHRLIMLAGDQGRIPYLQDAQAAVLVHSADAGIDLAMAGCGIFLGACLEQTQEFVMAGQLSMIPVLEEEIFRIDYLANNDCASSLFLKARLANLFSIQTEQK